MTAPVLREYQVRGRDALREEFRRGKRSVLGVAPTGAGKTVLFSSMAAGHVERGGRVVVVVHRVELLDQSVAKLASYDLNVGAIISGRARNPHAPIQVASTGTLLAMRKRGEEMPPGSLLVLDEAHHYVAAEWKQIAAQYAAAKIVGVTATPERGDGTPLGDLFEALVPIATVRELIEAGYLVRPRVIAPAKKRRTVAMDPVEAYLRHARDRRAVVFCPSIEEAEATAKRFSEAGYPAASVDCETPDRERAERLAAIATGALRIICNVFALTEGWDCPPVDCCILARGFSHVGSYLQAVGRVLRPSPGKTDALVLDLRGVVHKHGLPDDDRTYSLDGRAISGAAPTKECIACGATIPLCAELCPHCGATFGTDTDEPFEPGEDLKEIDREKIERECFAEWLEIAIARGYQPGWVAHKFRERFGRFPRKLWREAGLRPVSRAA